MAAPDSIYQLVEKFNAQHAYYTSPQYNETQVRVEFINPFFHALGWDVNDSQHVIHVAMVYVEENARMKPKHPDYAFLKSPRISGSGSPDYGFFVEAKAPHVDLRGGVSPAYQVRRYGWSARLPASALTDFEEFSLYDCRVRPNLDDNPRKDRLLYFTFRDYVDQWDTLFGLFSYEAVRDNQLDAYVRGKGERGASTVDDAFLRDLEAWRVMLAKHIALHNPGLTRRDINMAVQLTIDRIVFLRICEDRGIEAYGRLRDLQSSPAIYPELAQFFRQADARYNSGLFHFSKEPGRGEADEMTLDLTIPNEPLSAILNGLYYPVSPYEFSVLPAEILGQVYERFLGSVIELSEGGLAQVVEKPEVRKAGGVYYTPTYIVDYIVANTVGVLLEGKTPDEAANLRILDPACGSGSFLIGAYQYLLDWHLAYYIDKAPRGYLRQGILREAADGAYALTTNEKKRILLNNIYGVDLDQQAVEVSKLSLLLKMLEGETAASTGSQLQLIGERILPDLSDNIKWGNSLIGPDFYEGKQLGMFDDEALYKVKVFDWHNRNEGFGVIMARGGFDAVIGNPPYVRPHKIEPVDKEYFWGHYHTFVRKSDLYCCFIEQGVHILKDGGTLGFIVSNGWLRLDSFENLRRFLIDNTAIREIVDFTDNVFADATVKTCIVILSKLSGVEDNALEVRVTSSNHFLDGLPARRLNQALFSETYKSIFDLSIDESNEHIKHKMRSLGSPLGTVFDLAFGLKTGDDSRFLTHDKLDENHKRLLRGENIGRYTTEFKGEYVNYIPQQMTAHRSTARPGNSQRFEQPKVLVRDTGEGLRCTFDDDDFYVKDVLVASTDDHSSEKLKYLTGILNSRLMRFYYETSFPTLHVQRDELASLPIRTINFDDAADVARHERMVALVGRMLDLHRQLGGVSGQAEKIVRAQIESTDREIDSLVYELYGLTDEEIRIVEETPP